MSEEREALLRKVRKAELAYDFCRAKNTEDTEPERRLELFFEYGDARRNLWLYDNGPSAPSMRFDKTTS